MKVERLKTRISEEAHPLVVGEDAYQRFLTVMYESMKGQLARRGELSLSKPQQDSEPLAHIGDDFARSLFRKDDSARLPVEILHMIRQDNS